MFFQEKENITNDQSEMQEKMVSNKGINIWKNLNKCTKQWNSRATFNPLLGSLPKYKTSF